MAKRRIEPVAEAPAVPTYAQKFARDNRLVCLSKAEGEALVAQLERIGFKFNERGNAEARVLMPRVLARFVIDLKQ